MNLEEKVEEGFLTRFAKKTRKVVLPLTLATSILTSRCDCNSPTEPKKSKQEIVQLNPVITTTKTNKEGIVNLQDPETEEISTLNVVDKETQQPLQNINIACYNNNEENIQVALAQDSSKVYFSKTAYFYPNIAKIAEMPNYYRMLLEKDLTKPFIHFELEIPEYMPKRDKTFLGTTTLRDLHKFYEEHDTLFNNADILEFYFSVLGVKNHPAAVFATRLNEARSKFIENMATFTDMMNIILGGDGQDPDAWYWDVYKSYITGFGIVQHEINNTGLCTLKGKVIDKNTKKPLEAIVSIDSKKDTSDVNGDYMITFIPEGKYTITCLKDGFKTASLDTLIKAAKYPSFVSTKKNFELELEEPPERLSKIAFVSDRDTNNEIYIMNSKGNIINLTNAPDDDDFPSWSHDGQKILFIKNGLSICEINIDGTNFKCLYESSNSLYSPSFSPDGKKIVFVQLYDFYEGYAEICVINVDGTNFNRLTDSVKKRVDSSPSWSPDGKEIIYISGYFDPPYDRYNICTMNSDGTNKVYITNDSLDYYSPSYSPDGTKIVFSLNRGASGGMVYINSEIYVMDSDGSNQINLTNNPSNDIHPSYHLDSTKIVFASNRDGNYEIYIMDSDGSNQINLTNHPAEDFDPAWSPYLDK